MGTVCLLGKKSLALASHPRRDKLLDVLPDLHNDAIVTK